ncbi:MAG: globin domain-containing protein, partial [Rhizobacter sp.]
MLNSTQIALVQTSFAQVEPIADAAAQLFYKRLFELDPAISQLFKGDMAQQGKKLMSMIGAAVRGLNDLDRLVPVVQQLGVRHNGYGVRPEHYGTVGAALLWTLEQGLGPAFTPEVRAAWTAVYGVLAETMQSAAAAAKTSSPSAATTPSGWAPHTSSQSQESTRSSHSPQGTEMSNVNSQGGRLHAAIALTFVSLGLSAWLGSSGGPEASHMWPLLLGAVGLGGAVWAFLSGAGLQREAAAAVEERAQAEALQAGLAEMQRQHELGAIDHVVDAGRLGGVAAKTAQGINALVASHIAVKMKIVEIVRGYAAGRLDVAMDRLPGKKAQITEAIDGVQSSLKAAAVEAERNLRLKNALDKCSTNVMIADASNHIVYMNETVTAMMQGNEAELRKTLPAFNARQLIGENIDVFHKNPAHQRGMLSALRSTHKTQISVGDLQFGLIANPITDASGQRVGTVVEWADRTAEVAAREAELKSMGENTRIKNALDKCTTNVMIADAGNHIVYMNETVTAMMQRNEAELRKSL